MKWKKGGISRFPAVCHRRGRPAFLALVHGCTMHGVEYFFVALLLPFLHIVFLAVAGLVCEEIGVDKKKFLTD